MTAIYAPGVNKMNSRLSVIIPSYNSSGTLSCTLEGLLKQKEIEDYEVIVVDSSDDENITELAAKFETSDIVRFIRSETRLTPSAGRNIGADHSSGSLLVFLDSDVVPSPLLLKKIKDAYETGHKAGGGGVEVPDFQKNKAIALAQYYLQFNEYLPTGKNRTKFFIPSCNFYCDKELFNRAGRFPEIRASEDVTLGLNLSRLTEILFTPDSTVSHIFRENWSSFLNNQKMLGKYVAIYRKNLRRSISQRGIFPIVLSPLFFIIKCARIIPRILKAGRYHILKFTLSLPAFMIGLFFWTIGFIQGSIKKEFQEL